VSSLVVLESQKDYDRFGISANTNTLGNAAFKQRGAVPEPQEWLLLILAALLLLVVIRRKSPVVPFGR
jgi:CHASE2 domain-containing sensor protein